MQAAHASTTGLLAAVFAMSAVLWAPFRGAPGHVIAQDPDPDDEAAVRRFQAKRTFRENCLICHSQELVTQQRLTAKQWKSEVEKMIGWGAPVPPDQIQALTDYLTGEFPATRVREPQRRAPLAELEVNRERVSAVAGDPIPGERLYMTHCSTCHGPAGQGAELGPNLVEKPFLLEPGSFQSVVKDGRNRMPGFAAVLSSEQSAHILVWLRGRRFEPPKL
jgi:mono/diheme cytochrome c family protein